MYTGNSAKEIIYDYHRQNMFLAQHPLIDIVAHPWWYMGPCTDGWTNDFQIIPLSMHNEFFDACIKNRKLFEVNLAAILLSTRYSEKFKKQYIDYLVMAKEAGVEFSIGSDCHNRYYDLDLEKSSNLLEKAGFVESDFSSPV
jgi:histidinol phosphatase-like PHP family hydrolase